MALTNAQYDEIMRGYQTRQLKNRRITQERLETVYKQLPQLKVIQDGISSASVTAARCRLTDDPSGYETAMKEIDTLKKEKADLLNTLGYTADYFEPIYTCKTCKDTGYVNGEKCSCFKQATIDVVYSQSNIKEILARENFSTFSYKYYSDEDINPVTRLSSLDTAKRAVAECKHFIEDFDNKPKNILFYGDTGVGKTFLSNCVAKELLEKGYSVIYFTAFQFFDILSKGVFQKDADAIAAHQNIYDCDLLIIDDLGTEFANAFTSSQLFLCVNERILRNKSTIISTNLNMSDLAEMYSERVPSRITSNYTVIKLFGDDIRIQKRRMQ
ncbi:MAG: ATP-binding protein [Agathobacter sp.]|nr:ATP-binding protein [Agathobacter sp.]